MLSSRSVRFSGLFLLPLVVAAGKPATPPRASRAVVEAKLRSAEPKRSPSDWWSLGGGVDEALIAIGSDAKSDVNLRGRAMAALGALGTANARRFIVQTIVAKGDATDGNDRLLLRRAAVALGWMGGRETPAQLAPLLDHADPDVRLDAAIALGLTRLAGAADPLRKHLATEPEARVRAQISRQLRVIEAANPSASPAAPRDETRDPLPPTVRP
jgi:HEAT repeat protein